MTRRSFAHFLPAAALALATACARNPDPDPEPDMVPETPVRVAPPVGAVKPGDCPEALRRALAKPDLQTPHARSGSDPHVAGQTPSVHFTGPAIGSPHASHQPLPER